MTDNKPETAIGSIFSGYGGIDMAIEQVFAGRTVWHVENNPAASKVLAAHWDVPNHGDITATDWASVEPVDILCGGWPCQPFSLAGKRLGEADARALWPYVAGAVRVLRPRLLVLENVSAVVASPEFGRVSGDLAALGYDTAWTCLRASDVGAPHRRERLFVVAVNADSGASGSSGAHEGEAWAAVEHRRRSDWPVADSSGYGWDEGWTESAGVVGGSDAALRGDAATHPNDGTDDRQWARTESGFGGAASTDTDRSAVRVEPVAEHRRCDTAIAGWGSATPTDAESERRARCELAQSLLVDDRSEPAHAGTSWGAYEPAIRRWERVTGHAAPAPTERNSKGGQRLAPRFVEWMMGVPAGWVTAIPGVSRNDQLKILGNGVVPLQCAVAVGQLLAHISERAAAAGSGSSQGRH